MRITPHEQAQDALQFTALAVGSLTLFSMTKIWLEAFWKPAVATPATEADTTAPLPAGRPHGLWPLVVPCVMLAALTLLIGFAGGGMLAFAERAAAQLLDPSGYIEAVLGTTGGES